jgi:PEGA domain-containing protein/FG-GAP repeat protein
MNKAICLLAFLIVATFFPLPATADPGDLLQTFLNPRPNTGAVDSNYWIKGSMAAVGDNLVIGFPWDDTLGNDAGTVCMFDTSTGKVLQSFRSPSPEVRQNFGCSVAAVKNRIVVGAYKASTPELKNAGAAYVFDAATGELLHTLAKPSPASRDFFGSSVAVLGNNFVVSCRGDDTGGKGAGSVFSYDGATGELLQVFRKPKPETNDGFGNALAAVGKNLLVGAYLDDTKARNAGAAYLFDGETAELLQTFHNPDPSRSGGMGGFARAMAALGDNVLIGDKSFLPSRADGGIVYLFDGTTGDLLRSFNNPAPVIDDGFGQSLAVVDGNVLVGANHANANGFNVGAAHLFDGATGEVLHTFLNPTPDWNDGFGVTVAALGNNVAVSAPLDDTGGLNFGAVHLFEGAASGKFGATSPPVSMVNSATTRLYVQTTPPGAKVLLDGKSIGISNGLFFAPTGNHKIALELPGHVAQTLAVKIAEGQITRVEATLKRRSQAASEEAKQSK